MTMPTITPDQSSRELELTIGGMTCASCAARIEKKLNKLQGVSATVNYATEKAKVSFPATLNPADLVGVVEAIPPYWLPTEWGEFVLFIVAFGFVLFRPTGLVGAKKKPRKRSKELSAPVPVPSGASTPS